jgi:hypothetical protein
MTGVSDNDRAILRAFDGPPGLQLTFEDIEHTQWMPLVGQHLADALQDLFRRELITTGRGIKGWMRTELGEAAAQKSEAQA